MLRISRLLIPIFVVVSAYSLNLRANLNTGNEPLINSIKIKSGLLTYNDTNLLSYDQTLDPGLIYLLNSIQSTDLSPEEGRYDLQMLALLLSQTGRLHFFDLKQRQALAKQSNNPIWLKKNGKNYSLYGAYDCNGSHIYIDSSLSPYDIVGTFVHEVDHLLRDRLINATYDSLLDETFSALKAAHVELNISRVKSSKLTSRFSNNSSSLPVLSANEFKKMTLVNAKGPLSKSWQSFISLKLGNNDNVPYIIFSFEHFFNWLMNNAHVKVFDSVVRSIEKVYGLKRDSDLDSDFETLALVGNVWFENNSLWTNSSLNEEKVLNWANFISSLKTPSNACRMPLKPGDAGVRPGDAGVRPTLKPCLRIQP